MEMTEWSELIEEAEAAYTDARHWVFDRPCWTAQDLLTPEQMARLARLDQAEAAVRDHRQRCAAVADRWSPRNDLDPGGPSPVTEEGVAVSV